MRLVIRNLVVTDKDDILFNNAGYTFLQGKAYRINTSDRIRKTLFDCISYEGRYDSGKIELMCNGRNCMSPVMVAHFDEEPVFPEFLTIREFLKYYIDLNSKNIMQPKTTEEYLKMVELSDIRADRLLRDFTWEERVRLQFLCFLISMPPILIVDNIKTISNLDFLKDIKGYIDSIKENGIVLLGCSDNTVSVFLSDEEVTVVDGCLQGGI